MVVRSLLRNTLARVPYSDHVPQFVSDILSEDPSPPTTPTVPDLSKNPYECESDDPLAVSPKVKIHAKILKNRHRDPVDTFPIIEEQDEDSSSYDEELTYLNHCDTCDDIPVGISRMGLKIPLYAENVLDSPAPSLFSGSTIRGGLSSEDAGRAKEVAESLQREIRTKQYLNEQNEKFDKLISKNIDVFFKQQNSYNEKDSIMHKIEKEKRQNNFVRRIIGDVMESCMSKVGLSSQTAPNSPNIKINRLDELLSNASTVKEKPDSRDSRFSELLRGLDHNAKMDLYTQLHNELGGDTPRVADPTGETTELDKLQTFLILSIKLSITSMKLAIPVAQYLYQKYINNQIYLVNNKNAHSLADFVLKMMKGLESQLSHKEEWISRTYSKESPKPEQVGKNQQEEGLDEKLDSFYEDFTMGATNALRQQLLNGVGGNDESWRRAATEYVLNKCLAGSGKKEDYSNAKYGIYYSSRRNQDVDDANCSASSSSSSPVSFKSVPVTRQTSSDNLEALSVFHIAEKFAGGIGP
ncbi:uncharacterized protein CANTADRAFT_7453 [Suhomyces tanzawaensis NRRL Y-17324]|uniref:Uncharacterized protein n=1 Tax=Suhomyces tanzawaensis NRRL Y-17324 TaxID=984487 RepID=A0A1E4SES5_9ASCO|nr:uncharacterized protein CANTADRAFT_7453 [Suhomyces tanzawaensis NRRL Y-17324]ODV77983.1 hypothetical protein CANTADRAFT_7453 [Suhomyces tanzawaensis NRRL Y-17324]